MGLFEKAGRRFEQFKQEAEGAAEQSADYVCTTCNARSYAERDRCPECGDGEMVPVDREEYESDTPDED